MTGDLNGRRCTARLLTGDELAVVPIGVGL